MTHELKKIVERYQQSKENRKAVLASVVALDGSSYRRPGVRMLLFEDGEMVGAVSGGCVEKEVLRQASSVFTSGVPKVMVYDGRYRLGCEGILYILLEPFSPADDFLSEFWEVVSSRKPYSITSYYVKDHSENSNYGSLFDFNGQAIPLSANRIEISELSVFEQELKPCFQLVIIGAEHDAVQLCQYANLTGWEVTVVASPREEKTKEHFPGVHRFLQFEPEGLDLALDEQTAVILMTHSFVKDLGYLLALREKKCAYLGLLGPARRREKLFDEILERHPEISEEFLEGVHGPAGIDIGAETPQEIAISILSEILTVFNKKEPQLLKEKTGTIHS
ncbi:XdhC family protein [Flagellimonas allohymeniacidonis]|uniref:XdhC/CoxI family protein n=1 Tax=Flagellimonas allohymeniacidonis TaxID=2517819 RepID=A0A4Q8QJW5_9FLAO|nr:XdhC/CoxI family protein [Allomuricauda hymeniacidonis]TAI48789.1 XdhC/CoxI family protein [Allomuricauda hymeniacidonis]